MVGPARPSIDVEGTLDDGEWLELYRQSLRLSSFWPRQAALAALVIVVAGLAAVFGVGTPEALAGGLVALAMLGTYIVGYVWLGPWLRCRRVDPAQRTARWRISADAVRTDAGGSAHDLAWRDVDRVRVTRRLVLFELAGGQELLGLPRRTATELGETLILRWAENTLR